MQGQKKCKENPFGDDGKGATNKINPGKLGKNQKVKREERELIQSSELEAIWKT